MPLKVKKKTEPRGEEKRKFKWKFLFIGLGLIQRVNLPRLGGGERLLFCWLHSSTLKELVGEWFSEMSFKGVVYECFFLNSSLFSVLLAQCCTEFAKIWICCSWTYFLCLDKDFIFGFQNLSALFEGLEKPFFWNSKKGWKKLK